MPSFLSDDFLILVLYGATEKGNSMMRGYFFVNVSTSVFHAFFFSYFNAPPPTVLVVSKNIARSQMAASNTFHQLLRCQVVLNNGLLSEIVLLIII